MLRIVLYDYVTEKVRRKVRSNLKRVGIHAQWSCFETEVEYQRLIKLLLEEEENYRVAVFRIDPRGKTLKIGKEWEKIRVVF